MPDDAMPDAAAPVALPVLDAATGAFVGGCGLNQFKMAHGFCNLGYWVRLSCRRRGATQAAVHALARYAFGALGLGRVEIVVPEHNLPSRAVAAKAGARLECVARNRVRLHGAFVDACMLSIVPDDGVHDCGKDSEPRSGPPSGGHVEP